MSINEKKLLNEIKDKKEKINKVNTIYNLNKYN